MNFICKKFRPSGMPRWRSKGLQLSRQERQLNGNKNNAVGGVAVGLGDLSCKFTRKRCFSSIGGKSSSNSSCDNNNGFPKSVRIVEVGPRDGLQNEKTIIPTDIKVDFIDRLSRTGLQTVEATSFVSPDYVPQMGDHSQVMQSINRLPGVSYPVLTPNMKGFEGALETNCEEVAVFAAASETFSKKNLNCTIEKSLERFKPVCKAALENGIKVRGYVSCVLGCPYEGFIPPEKVLYVSAKLLELGCYEISLGDTIGIGTAGSTANLLSHLRHTIPVEQTAVHFHDTYGQALTNIFVALQHGVSVVDSSVSGLGGCPFARGATGNVASEDVVYMLHGLGIETGIDLERLTAVGDFISDYIGRGNNSRAGRAMIANGSCSPLPFS